MAGKHPDFIECGNSFLTLGLQVIQLKVHFLTFSGALNCTSHIMTSEPNLLQVKELHLFVDEDLEMCLKAPAISIYQK